MRSPDSCDSGGQAGLSFGCLGSDADGYLAFLEFHSIISRKIPRRLLPAITCALAEALAVALLGPRQVGKTTLALQLARSRPSVYLTSGRRPTGPN